MQNQIKRLSSIQQNSNEQEQQIVVFKFKRAHQAEIYDELKIKTKKIKPNPQHKQKAQQSFKKSHIIDRELMLQNLFAKLQLTSNNNNQTNQNNQNSNRHKQDLNQLKQRQKKDHPSALEQKNYFLKRVKINEQNLSENQKINSYEQNQNINNVRSHAQDITIKAHKQDLHQKFNKLRKINENQQNSNAQDKSKRRIKYKVIDIKQQNIHFVQFNGQKFEYQDLSKQYTQKDKMWKTGNKEHVYDYYILEKGQASKLNNNQPEIILPEEAEYLIENQQQDPMLKQQRQMIDQQDSNRSDRSDYDYPQEDYKQNQSDNSSQEIISGNKRNNRRTISDQEQDLNNSYEEQDEQQYYRKYLKRCRMREQGGNDQFEYTYNMKPVKYDSDSDD